MSIYVTGDTHGEIDFDKLVWFSRAHPELTKNDYVIICGDFGGVWGEDTEDTLNRFSKRPFTTLWVDGNHENYARLKQYPVSYWNGGKVQMIRPDIIHLMRGQIFNIEGNTIFTFGGAESHDKKFRTYGQSIWHQEVPNLAEIREAERNLDKVGWQVDYIITHSCDTYSLFNLLFPLYRREEMKENKILCEFEERLTYKHWYFGHYHIDGNINSKKTVLYHQVIPLGASAEQRE